MVDGYRASAYGAVQVDHEEVEGVAPLLCRACGKPAKVGDDVLGAVVMVQTADGVWAPSWMCTACREAGDAVR